jgi:hypothetical protein
MFHGMFHKTSPESARFSVTPSCAQVPPRTLDLVLRTAEKPDRSQKAARRAGSGAPMRVGGNSDAPDSGRQNASVEPPHATGHQPPLLPCAPGVDFSAVFAETIGFDGFDGDGSRGVLLSFGDFGAIFPAGSPTRLPGFAPCGCFTVCLGIVSHSLLATCCLRARAAAGCARLTTPDRRRGHPG